VFKAIKSIVITALVCLTAFQFDTTSVSALPSGISSKATAQSQLDSLTVKTEGSMTGYSRARTGAVKEAAVIHDKSS